MLDNDTLSVKEQFRTLRISFEDRFVDVKPAEQTDFCGPNLITEVSYEQSESMEGNISTVQNPERDWEAT